ncbi:hypothetical protein [Fructilactobacillus fructivorans]|uniref:hypothetical protein n=1 Tax=Fructilactobacillus fructivorans TaxID=1614 RepID=UPI000704C20A|nr:hypothetical protein [Fructilactobacillus fructivorans]
MWKQIKENRFITMAGLETASLGIYLLVIKDLFEDEQDIFAHVLAHAQDPLISSLLVFIGGVSFAIGIMGNHGRKYHRVCLSAMFGIWVTYFVIFFWHDMNAPGIPLHLSSILILFLIANIFVELIGGGD